MIRDVSPGGCRLVTNSMDDLPEIIHLLPEGFEQPFLGRIIWRNKNICGVQFLSAMPDDCLLICPDSRRSESESGVEKARVQPCSQGNSFRDRFQFHNAPRDRAQNARQATDGKRQKRGVGDFVSRIVHELRTPLTSILGSLGLISHSSDSVLPGKVAALINIAQRNAKKLALMVNDLLALGKAKSGEPEFKFAPVDIVVLARESIEVNRPYADKYNVRFQLDDKVESAYVQADAARLEQVLTNLLSNAAKFSPEGESVDLIVEQRGERIRVSVCDRGSGIPLKMQQQIFEEFVQAGGPEGRDGDGTGLGLSICKSIIDSHNSSLQLESAPGRGSSFFFELPQVEILD